MKNIEDIYPISPMQEGMLFHSLNQPQSGLYVEQSVWTMKGLEVSAFVYAWEEVVRRHGILRTSFLLGRGECLQVVRERVRLPVEQQDWRGEEEGEQRKRLEAYLEADRVRGFEMDKAPLLRLAIFRTGDEKYEFVSSHHHALLDGWSVPIVIKEVFELYESRRKGETVRLEEPRPYRDYIAWLGKQDLVKAEVYWREKLKGFSAPTRLGIERHSEESSYEEQTVMVSEETTLRLQRVAREHGLTLNTIMQGAWAILLSKYSGQGDVIFGGTISGRPAEIPGIEKMVGLFINTLPVRVRVDGAKKVIDWLKQLQEEQVEARQYSYTPLVRIQGWSEIPPGEPLFDTLLVYENFPIDAKVAGQAMKAGIEKNEGRYRTSYPITLLSGGDSRLWFQMFYDEKRFSRGDVGRVLEQMETMLNGMFKISGQCISEVSLLKENERQLVVLEWNETGREYSREKSIQQLFEEQVERTPEEIAVVIDQEKICYRELNERSNQLARHVKTLCRPDSRVGIYLSRSIGMIVAMIAVLKAGAVYVPLDPIHPPERLEYMLADSMVALVLTEKKLRANVREKGFHLLCMEEIENEITRNECQNLGDQIQPDDLLYVIYTSGSTGKPKGIGLPQRAMVNLLEWHWTRSSLASKTLQFASFGFDMGSFEILSALCSGGSVVLVDASERNDIPRLARLIVESGIEQMMLPVSVLDLLSQEFCYQQYRLPELREIITAGEQLQITPSIVEFFQRQQCVLHNYYGPSETHVVTAFKLSGDPETWPHHPSIGSPIANTEIYLLDEDLNPVPVGVPGELYVGGVNLARGYWNRADLTAERFVPNPFESDGSRLYRTGDLARYESDGNIELLGRIDHQVKIRGYRIELGEIESILRAQPGIREAVVIAREDRPGDKRLVAYIVVEGKHITEMLLGEELKRQLPEYMVPAAFVMLDKLPLNASGKIDHRALPSFTSQHICIEDTFVDPVEQVISSIWTKVLGVKDITVTDNFFALGGHSLSIAQVVSRIREILRIELPLRQLFENPTIRELSNAIKNTQSRMVAPQITRVQHEGSTPLSYSQERLWFMEQFRPGTATYNMSGAVRLRGALNFKALHKTLNELLQRHEIFRTRFFDHQGAPRQEILRGEELTIAVQEIENEDQIGPLVVEEAQRTFDLALPPLLRARLLRLSDEDHTLVITMHHIVSDGWSLTILIKEMSILYEAYALGIQPFLPGADVRYCDYAVWQRNWFQGGVLDEQLAYWKKQLANITPLDLPADRARPKIPSVTGNVEHIEFDSESTSKLKDFSKQAGVTLFMTMLATFKILLGRYTSKEDIAVGCPSANRCYREIENIVGFFVNMLVLRTDLSGDPTFEQLLRRIKASTLDAYTHQNAPFEKVVEVVVSERNAAHDPLIQATFAMQNTPKAKLAMGPVQVLPVRMDAHHAKHDLEVHVTESDDRLLCTFIYSAALYDSARIKRMVAHFRNLLQSLVSSPDIPISELSCLSDVERMQLLRGWNRTRVDYQEKSLHQLVEDQATKTPDAIAVIQGEQSRSYFEINALSNKFANYLRKKGVYPQMTVAIFMERKIETLLAFLGALKAGAAYIPLDTNVPKQRLDHILSDSAAKVVLTQRHLLPILPHNERLTVIFVDEDWPTIDKESSASPAIQVAQNDLAYIIYTSGSTGTPKGVAVEHAQIVNHMYWMSEHYPIEAGIRVLQKTALGFDASIWEFYAPLMAGGSLVLTAKCESNDPQSLAKALSKHRIDIVQLVPSLLRLLLQEQEFRANRSLRRVFCGGEVLTDDLRKQFRTLFPHCQLINLYGPTETTIDAVTWDDRESTNDSVVPIGGPIANTKVYVLDKALGPVPIGIPGELYVSGSGVARGYLNRAALTAERFIPDPFSEDAGSRMYQTGDLVRWMDDGKLEFLGRMDDQVKIRGCRLEPGEIEAVLLADGRIREAVVVLREDEVGEQKLAAYMVIIPGNQIGVEELRNNLKARLPEYMVPSVFVTLREMPRNANGKVDRKALPAPEGKRPELEQGYIGPRNEVEEKLCRIWREVLGLDRVGIRDNFFSLGGHSLLATQVASRIHDAMHVRIPLHLLFDTPILEDLSRVITSTVQDKPPVSNFETNNNEKPKAEGEISVAYQP